MELIRNPFVTKGMKKRAAIYSDLAITISEAAESYMKVNPSDLDGTAKFIKESYKYKNKAARCMGFRNFDAMRKYCKKRGII